MSVRLSVRGARALAAETRRRAACCVLNADVRFTPESGHWNSAAKCPLWVVVSSGRRNTFSQTQEMEWIGGGSKICSRFQCGVAEEELRNRWRCAFAAQPSGSATQ